MNTCIQLPARNLKVLHSMFANHYLSTQGSTLTNVSLCNTIIHQTLCQRTDHHDLELKMSLINPHLTCGKNSSFKMQHIFDHNRKLGGWPIIRQDMTCRILCNSNFR